MLRKSRILFFAIFFPSLLDGAKNIVTGND
jgi:hypothetical protein